MSQTLQDLIPGLREAEQRHRDESSEAFAGVEPKICGRVTVLPMTSRMFIDLQGADNAFVCPVARPIDETDLMVLLWRCGPCYKRGDDEVRRFYQGTLVELPYADAVVDVLEFVRRSLAGQPLWKGKARATPGVGQWAARLVHIFAKEYGWTEDQVLDLPFRRLWQYANRIMEDADPTYKEQAPEALRIRGRWLADRNAARAAAAAAPAGGRG